MLLRRVKYLLVDAVQLSGPWAKNITEPSLSRIIGA